MNILYDISGLGLQDVKVLRRAADLVEQGHCKGASAKNKRGNRVESLDISATSWCLVAAIVKAATEIDHEIALHKKIRDEAVGWNDAPETTSDEVIQALHAAADSIEQHYFSGGEAL